MTQPGAATYRVCVGHRIRRHARCRSTELDLIGILMMICRHELDFALLEKYWVDERPQKTAITNPANQAS